MNRSSPTGKWLSVGLGALQAFIALAGLAGGVGLIADPSGANLGLTVEPLSDSPFANYLVPGIVLFVVVGAGNLLGSAVSFLKVRYAGETGVGLGVFLMAWITIQVWWIGLLFWLQPFFFAIGALEAVLGFLLRRAQIYQPLSASHDSRP